MARLFAARDTTPTRTIVRTVRSEDEVRAFLRLLPRYRVLLHKDTKDDVNSFDHVIESLLHVIPALSPIEAERITWEAHTMGCAEVIVCLKEQAEHYRAGLRRQLLVSTIEPE